MHVVPSGRGIPPSFRPTTLHYWPFDEILTADAGYDMAPNPLHLDPIGSISANGVGPTGKAIHLNGSNDSLGSGFPEPDLTVFNTGYTVSAWIRLESVPAATSVIIAHSPEFGGAGSANYTRFLFGVKNVAGVPYLYYQADSASGLMIITNNVPLPLYRWVYVNLAVLDVGGNTGVFMYTNGEAFIGGGVGAQTSGGANGMYMVGHAFGFDYFHGQIAHISFEGAVLTHQEIQDDFRAGMLWGLDTAVHLRVDIENQDRSWQDLTRLGGTDSPFFVGFDCVLGCTINEPVDAMVSNATIHLMRADNLNTLAKFMENSPLNRYRLPDDVDYGPDETLFSPLLELRREVKIYVARTPVWLGYPLGRPLVLANDWVNIFHGRIDSINWGRETIELQVRDLGAAPIDCYIETIPVEGQAAGRYGNAAGIAIQTIIDNKNVLTDAAGTAIGGSLLTDSTLYNVVFRGTGPNNLIRSGTHTLIENTYFVVEISDAVSSPNKFFWTATTVGTIGAGASNVNITGGAQSLTGGVSITFGSTTGHALGDRWIFTIADPLYVPVIPGFNITTYYQDRTNIMDAMNGLSELIGWTVRYKWDPNTGKFRLTLFGADRTQLYADCALNQNDYFSIDEMSVKLADIRNAIRVTFPDQNKGGRAATDTTPAHFEPSTVLRLDTDVDPNSTSLTHYGRRYMEVQEDQASRIDTLAEATVFADIMLRDLMEPLAHKSAEARCLFEIELNDYIRFVANDVHYSSDQQLAISNVSHEFSEFKSKTKFNLRGRPSGNRRRHIAKAANSFYGHSDVITNLDQTGVHDQIRSVLKPALDLRDHDFEDGRTSRSANVINNKFVTQYRGPTRTPEGWTLTAGDWDTTGDAYASESVLLIGERSVEMKTGTAIILSDHIPVEKSGWYQASACWQSTLSIAGPTFTLKIKWYDDNTESATLLATDTLFTEPSIVDDTWQVNRAEIQADPDAVWAKLELSRSVVVGESVFVQYLDLQPIKPSFSAISDADITAQTANTWVQVTNLNVEDYDFHTIFASDTMTATEEGMYEVFAQALVRVDNVAAASCNMKIKLTKNGSDWRFGDQITLSTGVADNDAFTLRVIVPSTHLDSGDEIEVYVTDVDNNFDIVGANGECHFSGRLLNNEG